MKKFVSLILVLILPLSVFTGCNYTNGIDEYYFIISLGLDVADNGLIKLSIQNSSNSSQDESGSSSSSSSQSSNYKIYSVEAKTIDEGITILNNYLNKKINLTHCSALIISEELAKKGIKSYINTLSNNPELRHTCNIIISSTTAFDLMDKVSNSGEVFSARLYDYLTNTTDYTGFTVKSTFGKFFQGLDNGYYEPSAIYTLVGDSTVQTAGIAVFNKDKMIGHIDVSQSIAHLIATNELEDATITLNNPFAEGENIDLEISLYKDTDINIELINNTPFISLCVYPEGAVLSSGDSFNYINDENIKKLEKEADNYIEKLLDSYLYTITKKYNSDILGLKALYKSHFLTRDEFEKVHWDEIFGDSFFDIKVITKINSSNLFNKE